MAQTVQSVGQASSVLGRDSEDAARRLRMAELAVGGILVAAAIATGSKEAVIATALAAGASYALFDWLILK
jgi:predicted butyrate kinase (DUF1464 family)